MKVGAGLRRKGSKAMPSSDVSHPIVWMSRTPTWGSPPFSVSEAIVLEQEMEAVLRYVAAEFIGNGAEFSGNGGHA